MDMTPVRTMYFPDINVEVGDFDQVHMCRDFSKLQRWMEERVGSTSTDAATPQTPNEVRPHLLGYPDNEESMLSWDTRGKEFD
jgi:hypothetical protein